MLSVDEVVQVYRQLSHLPYPETGRLEIPENYITVGDSTDQSEPLQPIAVQTRWSQRDVIRGEKLSLTKTIFLQEVSASSNGGNGLTTLGSSPFTVQEARVWDVVSNSGELRAVCVKKEAAAGESKGVAAQSGAGDRYFVQIWRDHELVKTIDLTSLEKHGSVYPDDTVFGGFVWSYHDGHLLYTAEKFVPPRKSFFKTSAASDKQAGTADGDDAALSTAPATPGGLGLDCDQQQMARGHEYDWQENWGEQLTHARSPVLCILDIDSETVSVLDNVPAGVAPGQAVWCPDDTGVLFVGWQDDTYKLGLVYCSQRPSAVYHIDFVTAVCRTVGHANRAVSSIRFSPNGRLAVWLEQEAGGAHQQCRRLICCHWKTKEIRVIIDVVDKAGDGFPGINCTSLAPRCWCTDNRRLVLHSIWRTRVELLLIDTDSKIGRMLSTGLTVGTGNLLDVAGDVMLARLSSPSRPHYLAVARVPLVGQEDSVCWTPLKIGNGVVVNTVSDVAWTILHHTPTLEHRDYGAQEYESLLIGPSDTASLTQDTAGRPLIVFPHGGPHSVLSAEFNLYIAGLVLCGYAVLAVNYRGSLGFGQDSIRSLLGHVGENDVADCFQATQEALSSNEMFRLDPRRVGLLGGSHGGFLVAHLSARYPQLYRVTVARNPVVNMATMVGCSDIPDWCWVEAGLGQEFSHRRVPTAEALTRMLQASPIVHVDGVCSPTLVVLGLCDLRVPNHQGHEWYKALKARGVPTRLLLYPKDAHPIVTIPAESDCFINIVLWYQHYWTVDACANLKCATAAREMTPVYGVPSVPNIDSLTAADITPAPDTADKEKTAN